MRRYPTDFEKPEGNDDAYFPGVRRLISAPGTARMEEKDLLNRFVERDTT